MIANILPCLILFSLASAYPKGGGGNSSGRGYGGISVGGGSDHTYDLSTGAIVAIIVGSLAAGFMIWVAWKLYNRRKEKAAGYEKQGLTGAEWEDDVPYTVKAAEEDRIAAEEARVAMMVAETAEEPRRNKRSSKSHWFNNWSWF